MSAEWIFTFGVGDPAHARCFVVIPGTRESAREEMVRRFGTKWAFQYPIEDKARVADRWGLTELPLSSHT